jgi:hypothetical protein
MRAPSYIRQVTPLYVVDANAREAGPLRDVGALRIVPSFHVNRYPQAAGCL